MKKHINIVLLFILISTSVVAQESDSLFKYRRSSIYSMLLNYPNEEFAADIAEVFDSIPLPEKFNDHNLSVRVINSQIPPVPPLIGKKNKKLISDASKTLLDETIRVNAIARRLVARWFNWDYKNAVFNLDLIAERGYYDASSFEINIADESVRGRAMLVDAGEELIGNTFLLVNDIQYVDKEAAAAITSLLFSAVESAAKISNTNVGSIISSASGLGSTISDQIAGFKVKVTTYLYKLEWNDEVATKFYTEYYTDVKDENKTSKFKSDISTFKLDYIGSQFVVTGKTTLKGTSTKNDMIRKVCIRAIDESIAKLQKEYDEFKVKTALTSVDPITAYIGRKEGIDEDSKFEVLEVIEDENGVITYERAGIISPISGKIWDNRYLADADEFKGSGLGCTTFKKVSGKDFYPGMLIREIK